jgi:valyl-tRNA synthetase
MTEPLSTQYDPRSIEGPLYRTWEERGYFRADASRVLKGGEKPFVIVMPPPNVTAVLHTGHGLGGTVQDVLTRFHRMQGQPTLWLPGTDHAGIATQNVVERILAKEGKTRYDVGREKFVERVWEYVSGTGATILEQLRAIGASCDWSRTRFTLEPALSRAVRETFVHLYEKGLIYRGNYIINWCPRCLTALSDEEAEAKETNGKLYHLRYPLVGDAARGHGDAARGRRGDAAKLPTVPDGRPYVVVATTRPETMLADTAVAVHPADERYSDIVGADVELPLTGRTIPVIADDFVDSKFGTGAVKATPAHDPIDFEFGKRHGLPMIDIMTAEATLNDNAPPGFRGLDRFEARQKVVQALREQGLLEKIEDHAHSLPHCYRCDTIVEPRLSDQWFVRMKPLGEAGLAASRDGRVHFTPDRWTKVYERWLEGIRDWCISRQLWWGHRIPVWYCQNPTCGEMIVAREDPDRCAVCGCGRLEQDPDVLDTWFSSWLWPFSTLGWPDETEDLKAFYPTTTLVSAYDIIFFWVARMIMAGLELRGEVPYHDVYITGLVRDHLGRKMSKSAGNGIDPLEVVNMFGADAFRYTVLQGAGVGTDVNLNYENLEETFSPGRNFANKLWNAGRFALLNLEGKEVLSLEQVEASLELADRWILSRLNAAVTDVTRALDTFRFHDACETLYHFFWGDLADWYLELIKPRFSGTDERSRAAASATLSHALDTVLRLLHPIMPFVTDELWQRLPLPADAVREESLVIAKWPAPDAKRVDAAAEEQMTMLIELIGEVRTLRAEYGVPASSHVRLLLTHVPAALGEALRAEERALRMRARVGEVTYNNGSSGGAGAHAVLRGGTELFLPLEGVIDVARERQRLDVELKRLEGLLRSTEGKLQNEQFRSKAPPDVIARETEKADSLRDQVQRLAGKLAALA